jgi:hypothetical protein
MRRPATPLAQLADLGGFFHLPADVSGTALADLAAAIEPPAIVETVASFGRIAEAIPPPTGDRPTSPTIPSAPSTPLASEDPKRRDDALSVLRRERGCAVTLGEESSLPAPLGAASAPEPPAAGARAAAPGHVEPGGLAAGEAGAGMISAGRAPFLDVELGESEVRAAAGAPHALVRPGARRGRFR